MVGALDGTLQGDAKPYGFALTVWLSGELLTSRLGTPSAISAALFVAGAVSAFGLLRFASSNGHYEGEPTLAAHKRHVARAGAIHVAAIGAGSGAAALLARLGGPAPWPLAGFAAVLLYLLVTSVELLITEP